MLHFSGMLSGGQEVRGLIGDLAAALSKDIFGASPPSRVALV